MKRTIVLLLSFIVSTISLCFAQLPELGEFTGTYTHIATGQADNVMLNIQHALRSGQALITNSISLPGPSGSITGQANFMPLANGGYCISGNVLGTITVYPSGGAFLTFFINPSGDSGCYSGGVLVNATLSADGKSISGRYFDGQPDITRVTGEINLTRLPDFCAEDKLEDLRKIAEERKDTLDELYARFWSCLNENTCAEYAQTGENGIAGGFNRFVFEYMSAHPNRSALNIKCSDFGLVTSPTDIPGIIVPDPVECFEFIGKYHFDNELKPAFRAYCEKVTPEQYDSWDIQHDRFVENVNLPCFNSTLDGSGVEGLDLAFIKYARFNTDRMAKKLREDIQDACLGKQVLQEGLNTMDSDIPIQIPDLSPPLTQEELFSEELALAGTLKVTAKDETLFFLPEGTQVQLIVTKNNPDGSTTDVTVSPETEYSAPISRELASITSDGMLSILGSPSLFATDRPPLYVFVRNGNDRGIGQFAIVPNDVDGDLLADSYEMRFGLDPTTPNGVDSDVDGDGLSDWTELMINTLPTVPDTDTDGFSDKVEFDAGTDPLDAERYPAPPIQEDSCQGFLITQGCTVNGAADQPCRGAGGDDEIIGTSGNDVILGGDGNDTIIGRDGDDVLCGNLGNDKLIGEAGNDLLGGGEGEDTLDGGPGDDSLLGSSGNDTLDGGEGIDTLNGGSETDICIGGENISDCES